MVTKALARPLIAPAAMATNGLSIWEGEAVWTAVRDSLESPLVLYNYFNWLHRFLFGNRKFYQIVLDLFDFYIIMIKNVLSPGCVT